MNKHPNALTSAVSGGVGGSIVIAILAKLNLHISLYDAGLIYTAVSAFVLFVGRNGLQGVYSALLHGTRPQSISSSDPPKPAKKPAAPKK